MVPFLKWLGGKRRLARQIVALFPTSYGRYYEPFLGGGAIFLALEPKEAVLSDVEEALIETWQAVRDCPEELMTQVNRYGRCLDKESYYRIRGGELPSTPVERAARFLYLNKMAFAGMYRVNRTGGFNVPYGGYGRKRLYSRKQLLAASKALQGATLRCASFDAVLKDAQRGDLVYCDPPYRGPSAYYQATRFEHERLAETVWELDSRGCFVFVSHVDCPGIRELYRGFRVVELPLQWAVGSRPRVQELVFCNYS